VGPVHRRRSAPMAMVRRLSRRPLRGAGLNARARGCAVRLVALSTEAVHLSADGLEILESHVDDGIADIGDLIELA